MRLNGVVFWCRLLSCVNYLLRGECWIHWQSTPTCHRDAFIRSWRTVIRRNGTRRTSQSNRSDFHKCRLLIPKSIHQWFHSPIRAEPYSVALKVKWCNLSPHQAPPEWQKPLLRTYLIWRNVRCDCHSTRLQIVGCSNSFFCIFPFGLAVHEFTFTIKRNLSLFIWFTECG